ncbi:MAG TPA: ABC transporter permease [Candidatus Fermentibacter daniensis]|nr:ABC transporter permease [Candidatus Fermentibacter daniensis]HOR08234.1 ABC transporter permease [Candidatus Fermentibacter daniensis]HPK52782.1 ABC transporter permease [Candidatus Fermentibacter daniensis]
MKGLTAFLSILGKDMRTYYLKPPNISWGLIFPVAWAGMFLVRSGRGLEEVLSILPGIVTVSILFGTTSMLAVTVTFEKKNASFDRLLLAPMPLEAVMLAKTMGAILFGVINGLIPLLIASFLTSLQGISWGLLLAGSLLTAVSSTFMGLFVAVAVSEVFEAQTFSNFLRFPMIFLCGLFIPVASLPVFLRPLSYILPATWGADLLRRAVTGSGAFDAWVALAILTAMSILLYAFSLRNIRRKWIT